MEEDANDEGEADADPGVLQCVDPLEAQRLVDGDELVDRQADDDVNRADHEHIDQRDHEVSLEKNGISIVDIQTVTDLFRQSYKISNLLLGGKSSTA